LGINAVIKMEEGPP